jgi:aryl sulfotransferase
MGTSGGVNTRPQESRSVNSWPTKTHEIRTAVFDSTRWNTFEFRQGDVVVVTWGKSGTTWAQQVVSQLLMGGRESLVTPEKSWVDICIVPLEEMLSHLESEAGPRCLKTHLPVDALVFSPLARYIFIGRDVRDTVWSAYNHQASFTPQALEIFNDAPGRMGPPVTHPPCDIREYYLRFLNDGHAPGFPLAPFWELVQGWWDVRHLPNVLLVHFNNLLTDMEREMRRIAAFLAIDANEAAWPAIVAHCTFEYMRDAALKRDVFPVFFENGARSFFYRGTNGRWRDVLSAEEARRCDAVADARLDIGCAHWLRTGELDPEHTR